MEAKHTPGPWLVPEQESADLNISIKAPDPADPDSPWNVAVAIGACGHPDDQTQANARLIAAAPSLLEALKEAQSVLAMMVEPGAIEQTTVINAYAAAKAAEAKARAAISQAEGGE